MCQDREVFRSFDVALPPPPLSRPATLSIVATLLRGTEKVVTVLGSGQPADYRDDGLELIDDDDPELDLLDDLCDRDED